MPCTAITNSLLFLFLFLFPSPLLPSMASTSLLLLLLFFSFANAGLGEHDGYGEVKVLGSRPPLCVNRCMTCRPCRVTLVAFPRGRSSSPEEAGDESYYLVAWMCRCGDSLFRP